MSDKNLKLFQEKVRFVKFSRESENLSKIGGNLKQGGKYVIASGGKDAPDHHAFDCLLFSFDCRCDRRYFGRLSDVLIIISVTSGSSVNFDLSGSYSIVIRCCSWLRIFGTKSLYSQV